MSVCTWYSRTSPVFTSVTGVTGVTGVIHPAHAVRLLSHWLDGKARKIAYPEFNYLLQPSIPTTDSLSLTRPHGTTRILTAVGLPLSKRS
jgi:hypothetical protein